MFLQVAGLWALAVAQPLLDLLGANPEFFVAHRAGAGEVLALAFTLVAVLPALLAAGVRLAGLAGPRARDAGLYAILWFLASLLAMQLAVRAGATRWFLGAVPAAAAGVALVLAYRRWAWAKSFFSILSVAALLVPVAFLMKPGIRSLVLPRSSGPLTGKALAAGASANTPVVLVVFDELPLLSLLDTAGDIDRVLYPNLSALAGDGVWYRNATTVDGFTRWVIPAIVSGKYPREPVLPSAVDHPNTLFTLLASTHRMEVTEPLTSLCPERLCPPGGDTSSPERLAAMARDLRVVFLRMILTKDLTAGLPDPTSTWANFGRASAVSTPGGTDDSLEAEAVEAAVRERWREGITSTRVEPVLKFIEGIGADDPQPTFYFLHTLVSHHPHFMLPQGRQNRTWVHLPEERSEAQSWAIHQEWQRHLLQVGFVDHLVGLLMERLKEAGLYDDAVVVVTADHGASYLPDAPLRGFTDRSAAEVVRVPLVVKFPARIPVPTHVSDANAESIDIMPTIAEAVGIEVPWPIDGSSLLDPARPGRQSKLFFFGRGRLSRKLAPGEIDMGPALRYKAEVFGDSNVNPQRAPSVAGYDGLVGRALSGLRVVEGADPVEVLNAWEYEKVDPDALEAVFDVAGRFASPQPGAVVAVAVNGVVQAVTRTWNSNPRGWVATPRSETWRPGRNEIEVFLATRDQSGPLLRRAVARQVRPRGLNLVSAAAVDQWGVRQWGFYQLEHQRNGGREFRWTRARAELSNLFTYQLPRAVDVDVLMVPGGSKLLKIEANDCLLFDGTVRAGWSSSLSLEGCDLSRGLTLHFTTSPTRPPKDPRRLGVALSRVVLR